MRYLRTGAGVVVLVLVGWFLAMRAGSVTLQPEAFAYGVGLLMALLVPWFTAALLRTARRAESRGANLAEGVLVAGLLTVAGGGMANWLLGLQGGVVLVEGEKCFLSDSSQLNAFEAGPLAKEMEMGGLVELIRVDFQPEGTGFRVESKVRFVRGHDQPPRAMVVGDGQRAEVGPLRFYQGAFGFAPRIVLLKGDATVLDQEVPFQTRNDRRTLSFEGECLVESEQLEVFGAISLEGLDDKMKGHPLLGVEVRKSGRLLGRGELLPGHFADLREGYRIGFAGLKKWSEIDISRKNYPLPIFIGFGMTVLGFVAWPIAAWRKW